MNAILQRIKKRFEHKHRWGFALTRFVYPYGFVKYCRVCGEMIPAKFSDVDVK
jgi:hypothetical protein